MDAVLRSRLETTNGHSTEDHRRADAAAWATFNRLWRELSWLWLWRAAVLATAVAIGLYLRANLEVLNTLLALRRDR